MVEPAAELQAMHGYVTELDHLSKLQGELSHQHESVAHDTMRWKAEYQTALWRNHVLHGDKLPPEPIRDALMVTEMPHELSERFYAGKAEIQRLKDRIGVLKYVNDAHRSIMAALRLEAEAAG